MFNKFTKEIANIVRGINKSNFVLGIVVLVMGYLISAYEKLSKEFAVHQGENSSLKGELSALKEKQQAIEKGLEKVKEETKLGWIRDSNGLHIVKILRNPEKPNVTNLINITEVVNLTHCESVPANEELDPNAQYFENNGRYYRKESLDHPSAEHTHSR